jgi:hypothetical protein
MNFQERRYELLTDKFNKMGQKIVSHQSGFLNLNVGEGRLPRVGVEEQFPQGDEQSIAEAISYVQRISEQYPDEFAQWAAGANILNKVDGEGASVRKATVNRSGQTSDPINYPANTIGSTAGTGKSVWTKDLNTGHPNEAQLKRLIEGAEELLQQARMHEGHLRAKILHVSKL